MRAMQGVTRATQIVTLNSSGFRGILNGMYDLVIIDVHDKTELYEVWSKTTVNGAAYTKGNGLTYSHGQ